MEIPVGFAQVNLKFTGAAVHRGAQVTFGVENVTDQTPEAIGAAVGVAWFGTVATNQTDQIALDSVRVKLGPNETGLEAEVPINLNGTAEEEALPAQAALLVIKRTALGGRKNRGKNFWPGFTEPETPGGGRFSPASIAAIQGTLDAFLEELDTANIPMVVLHSDATAPTPVVALEAQSLMATQRRRIRRVGGRRTVAP